MIPPRLPLLLAALAPAPPLAAQHAPVADLEHPANGWTHGALERGQADYVAAYPKPPVDRGAQRGRTLIAGRLRHPPDARHPPTLVVNGTAMPLYADAEGRFARPWAFGAGSNSVELIGTGSRRQRIQFFENQTAKVAARLRAVLTWDDAHAEVDLHVITPRGSHAAWASPLLPEGGGLDVDSVDGAGPEIFSSAAPESGTWLFYVNYWGNFDQSGYGFDPHARERDVITARLTLIFNENTANERRETMDVPLRKVGEMIRSNGRKTI